MRRPALVVLTSIILGAVVTLGVGYVQVAFGVNQDSGYYEWVYGFRSLGEP